MSPVCYTSILPGNFYPATADSDRRVMQGGDSDGQDLNPGTCRSRPSRGAPRRRIEGSTEATPPLIRSSRTGAVGRLRFFQAARESRHECTQGSELALESLLNAARPPP